MELESRLKPSGELSKVTLLSPLLFNLCLEPLLEGVEKSTEGININEIIRSLYWLLPTTLSCWKQKRSSKTIMYGPRLPGGPIFFFSIVGKSSWTVGAA
jgi:hypothetical protein